MIHSHLRRLAGACRDQAPWAVPALVLQACLLGLLLSGDLREDPARFLLLYGGAFLAYVAALAGGVRSLRPDRAGFLIVLAVGLIFRLTLLPAEPTLSDDIHRYLWDGKVQQEGINPFLYPPDHPALEGLRDENWEKINHKEIPTIYPPLMQWVFRAGVFLGSSSLVSPSLLLKTLLVVFDGLLIWIVWRIALRTGGSARNVAIYAWNPLVIVEVAGSGHNDVVAVALLMAAVLYLIQARRTLSTTLFSLSILAKIVPVMAVPSFARRISMSRLWILPAICILGYLPFVGVGSGLFRGLSEYGHRWEGNDFLFRGLLELTIWAEPGALLDSGVSRFRGWIGDAGTLEFLHRYTHPQYLARILAFLAMAWTALHVSFKPWALTREILVLLSVVLLLSPTVHPWYLLWIVPLLAIHPARGLLLWTGLVALSYGFPPVAGFEPYAGPLLFAEYLPVLGILLVEIVRFLGRPDRPLPGRAARAGSASLLGDDRPRAAG